LLHQVFAKNPDRSAISEVGSVWDKSLTEFGRHRIELIPASGHSDHLRALRQEALGYCPAQATGGTADAEGLILLL
jgi:hypothetical protein